MKHHEPLERLQYPFRSDQIHWKPGAVKDGRGMGLAFIDARDVMNRLDDVLTPAGWQCRYPWSDGKKVVCEIGILLDGEWIWKSNGAGDTAFEEDKGALSDAFKRAAVMWGIGRYLYQVEAKWVDLVQVGNRQVFSDVAKEQLNQHLSVQLKPLRVKHFKRYYEEYRSAMDATIDALLADDLTAAADFWANIPEHAQGWLQLPVSEGGLLDQDSKKKMRSTEFRVSTLRSS